jgi:hypothetical protein
MALSAKQIRIGAVVSGRCGQRKFAGTVVEATDVTITVADADGETTVIAPAWADVLVVDGQETPAPKAIETIRHYTLKDRRPLPRLPANIADIERQRADKNLAAVTEWKAKKKQEEMTMSKMTPAEKVAAMTAARLKAIAEPVKCEDCPTMFVRKSLQSKRCPECARKFKLAESRRRSAGYRAAAKAAATAAPEKPVEGKRPLAPDLQGRLGKTELAAERPREPLATVPPAAVKPASGPAEAGTPNSKPVADETCRFCGDYYFPGITGVDGQCRKCLDRKQAAAGMAPLPSTAGPAAKPSSEANPSTLKKPVRTQALPAAGNLPRIVMVPMKALEQAHGQIQTLWTEIARLQCEIRMLTLCQTEG